MTNPWSYRSPDARLRDLQYARQVEEERAAGLDEEDARRQMQLEQAMQREQARSADLDRRDDIGQQMEVEEARSADLDKREASIPSPTEEHVYFKPGETMPPMTDEERRAFGLPVPTATPTPADGYHPMAPLAPLAPGFTEEDVLRRMQEQRERSAPYAGYDPMGRAMGETMGAVRRVEDPIAASALQAVSRTGPLGGPAMGPAQQVREMPMERQPIGEELVNPVSAWLGDEEEQRKAEEVLAEAGLPATLMAYFFTSPLNFLPVVGFTKVDDFLRVLKQATRVTGTARQTIIRSPRFQSTIAAIRRGGAEEAFAFAERGGPKVPGVGPEDVSRVTPGGPPREPPKPPTALAGEPPEGPLQTGLAKIKEYVAQSRRVQPGVEAARHEERLVRINKFLVERDRLIAGGVPVDEAISRATAKWRGKYPSETFAAVDLAPEEIDAFWRVLVDHPMAFEQDRALKALARGMRGEYIPPNEDALLRRLWGDDFADVVTATPGKAIQAAGRPSFLTQVIEEALNALLIPMHVMSSMDFSWGGRQMRMLLGGGFIGPRKGRLPITLRMPREWAKAVWEPIVGMTKKEEVILARDAALKADKTPIRVWTEDGFTDIPFGRVWDEMARGRKPIPGTKEANLAGVAGREERAPSSLVARVPGIKQSQQGFTLGINQGHHQILKDALLLEMEAGRKLTPEGVRAMGNFFNRVVGRGELGGTWVAKLARGFFWAPGLRLAFWQSAFNLAHKNPAVRAQARKYLAGYLGLGLSVMGLADLTGAGEVTWDPRNSDFGKINIKGIRFNVWGPDVVATRYLMQSIFGEAVSPLTGKYKVDWKEQLVRYSRSGAQPLVGFGIDIAEGKTFIGEEFTWTDWERWLPLAGQDVKDAWDLKGMPWGPVAAAITAPIAALGFGVQSYDKPEDRLARQYNEYVDQGKFGKDALYYADEDGLTVRANVQKFADLAKLDTERNILARMENNEIKAEKEEYYRLPDLAQQFNAGEITLGPEIMSKFREYKHDVHVAMDARTWGVDFGPESEDEKLLNAWMSINPHDEKYADPVTGQPDYNLVGIDSDAAKAALEKANPRLAKAVEEIISSLDPELAKLEPDLEEALRLRSDLYDTPRWTGVSPAKQREIEGLQELTDQFRDRLAAAGLDPGPVTVSQYQDAARQGGLDPGLAFVAWPLRGGDTEARSQDPAYLKFLFDNQAKLAIFFPELYDSRATLRFLEPDIQEAVIAAGAR